MSSNTDGEFTQTTITTSNRRKSMQQKQQLHQTDINKTSSSTNRRKTMNIVMNHVDDKDTSYNNNNENKSKKSTKKASSTNIDEIKRSWGTGTIVEARDLHDNWYKSRIIELDRENKRAKVHFFGWNSRYDQWFDISSNDLRPFEGGATTEEIQVPASSTTAVQQKTDEDIKFNVGEIILAKWIDNFYYPATVTRVLHKSNTLYYEVKFEDGVKKMVRCINCKVYDRENDVVSAKPIESAIVVEEKVVAPAIQAPEEPQEQVEVNAKDDSNNNNSSNVRKSARVKRPRTLSNDEISLFPIRRQSVGVNKKRKLNEEIQTTPATEEVTIREQKLEPVIQPESTIIESPPVHKESTLVVPTKEKVKKLPLGDYFKSLAKFGKKRNKETSLDASVKLEEKSKEEEFPGVSISNEIVSVRKSTDDVKFQVNLNDSNSSIKLKFSKLSSLKSEPYEVRIPQQQVASPILAPLVQHQLSAPPIELIRCKFSNCDKTFRKQHLLENHIKYHHYEDGRIIEVATKKRKLTHTEDASLDSSLNEESKKLKVDEVKKKVNEEKEEEETAEDDPYEVIHCKCDKTLSVGFMIQVS